MEDGETGRRIREYFDRIQPYLDAVNRRMNWAAGTPLRSWVEAMAGRRLPREWG